MANNWKETTLDKAVYINPSVSLKRGKEYFFVDMKAIKPVNRCVSESEVREYKGGGSRFMPNDTLMARITPCLENGKIARYVPSDGNSPAYGSTEFIVIRGREGITDNDFAYYLTRCETFRNFAISQMTGSSGRQRVPVDSISNFNLRLPPLPEQKVIAHILGTLDDKIELNRRMNETLEEIARAIFKKSFAEPTQGILPKGWKILGLDEIATFLNGLALQKFLPDGENDLPVIKIAQLRSGNTDGADMASSKIPSEYIIDDGDIIFSWSGSLMIKIWCGGKGALNQHLFKVTSEKYPKWFYYLWTSEHLSAFQHIAEGKATTMGHIQRYHLADAKVLVPDDELLKAMTAQIEPLLDKIVSNAVQSRTLAALRDTLLPKLLSGEIRVKDAEKLLEDRGL